MQLALQKMATVPMVSEKRPRVVLWPRLEPFEFGILHCQDRGAIVKLNAAYLKKFILHTKSKGGYPWLSYSQWLGFAKQKLHLTEELAWIYFETYGCIPELNDDHSEEKFRAMRKVSDISTVHKESARKKLSVDLLKFVLFLYIQNAPRVSLKSSIVIDQWPSVEQERKLKWSEERSHLLFLTSHMSDILQLLTHPSEGGATDHVITEEGVAALDFLISGSADNKRVCSVLSLATMESESSKSGYSKVSMKFSVSLLEVWLNGHMSTSCHGITSLLTGNRDSFTVVYKSDGKGRVFSNTQLAPSRHQCMLVAGLSKQTMALQDNELHFAHIRIQSCRHSYIYIIAPISSVRLERCVNCSVMLGAVHTTVVVNKCENITMVTASQSMHISSSSHCKFYLCVSHCPLILGGNSHLMFGPHNTNYRQLEDHMKQCGLHPTTNQWNRPSIVGDYEGVSEVWQLVPSDMFSLITIPFQGRAVKNESMWEVPSPYKEELDRRKKMRSEWFQLVEKANLSNEQTEQVTVAAQAQFKVWLERTGHLKELTTLDPSHQHHMTS